MPFNFSPLAGIHAGASSPDYKIEKLFL